MFAVQVAAALTRPHHDRRAHDAFLVGEEGQVATGEVRLCVSFQVGVEGLAWLEGEFGAAHEPGEGCSALAEKRPLLARAKC